MRPRTITGNKRALHRNLLLILQPREKTNEQLRSIQNHLLLTQRKVKDLLEYSLERLATNTEHLVPQVSVMILPRYGNKRQLTAYLNSDQVFKPEESRGIIYLMDIVDDGTSSLQDNLRISHFIGVKVSRSGEVGWSSSSGLVTAWVETNLEKLPFLIHDIALDIAMYHSWEDAESENDFEARKKFSEQKAKFAFERGLVSSYGPIREKGVRYFCIASHCRDGEVLLYAKYEAIWKELMGEDVLANRHQSAELKGSSAEISEILRLLHRDAGMLSLRKISLAIQGLPSGTYLLATARRKPPSKRLRLSIGNVLGGATWRKKMWKIVPFVDLKSYSRHAASGFITLFKFKVP